MKQTTSLLLALASLLVGVPSVQAALDGYCCLCDGCYTVDSTKYEDFLETDDWGKVSCVELDYKMTLELDMTVSSQAAKCSSYINNWKRCCCTSERNGCNFVDRPPSNPPKGNFPAGDHPWCDLCANGQYPEEPYTVAAIAYLPGNPTCADLYWMGRTGNIPQALCYPIQNFMVNPCGCLPSQPAPTPSNPTPSPPTSPSFQKPKVPQRNWKEDYKIGVIGRARGVTNVRGLKENA